MCVDNREKLLTKTPVQIWITHLWHFWSRLICMTDREQSFPYPFHMGQKLCTVVSLMSWRITEHLLLQKNSVRVNQSYFRFLYFENNCQNSWNYLVGRSSWVTVGKARIFFTIMKYVCSFSNELFKLNIGSIIKVFILNYFKLLFVT